MSQPNIIFIFCDDLGWGDVSCLNPDSKISTPHIDALAASGISFTDAHAGSAVCTPSRYTLLTGRYCWRADLKHGVGGGYSPPLIDIDRPTVASRLRDAGYATACFGKWHLGMEWPLREAGHELPRQFSAQESKFDKLVDFTRPIGRGPTTVGFDTFFGISASLDMSPYVYIHDDRATALPTGFSPAGTDELRARAGAAAPGWRHEDVLPELERRSLAWIDERAAGGQPFFLYLPVNGPHTPVVPTSEWIGKSGCGIYGDFVMQIDAVVGAIVAKLEALGIRDETAIFFSSDNGPETITAPYRERFGHLSAWKFRGMKRDNWEGGHRVPYIVSWPKAVTPGTGCDRFVELADFYATALEIAGTSPRDVGGEDSFSMRALLAGEDAPDYRTFAIHHSSEGRWAIRQGKWKLLLHSGSGGNACDCPENNDPVQLYDMESDPFETENVYRSHLDVVRSMRTLCIGVIERGRSTPGPVAANDEPTHRTGSWSELTELLELAVD